MADNFEKVYEESLEYFNGDELAASVFATKYALQDGGCNYLETSPDQMHRRLAKEFARIEQKYDNPIEEEEIYSLFKGFKYVIPQGSPMAGVGNDHRIQSLSNCFVVESPQDSYGGILKTDQEQVQIMKRRGGVGFDISTIRPQGLPTSNAAKTTDGIGVFMERFSNSCREVAQGGRRGALMLTISVHHPDVLTFVRIKRDLKKVTGANISVRLTDEFMDAIEADIDYELRFPVEQDSDRVVTETTSAREVWDQIIESAHDSAEPGLLFWDNVLRYTPAQIYKDEGFHTISTNPCSEITLSAYDSCRLLLLNLTSFVDDPFTTDAVFNYEEFGDKVIKAQRLMDDLVDLEVECIDKILAKITSDPEEQDVKRPEFDLWQKIRRAALDGRRTGLGITGLGDALAMLNLQYGSEASIEETGSIYRQLALSAYESSCYLARERGPFGVYDFEKEQGHPFMERLFNASPALRDLHKRYGRRNIALTTTAPCGSVSTLTQTTSGIEPAYKLEYTRRKKINPDDPDATVDFVDAMGDKWQEFQVYHHGFSKWMAVTGGTAAKDSPYFGSTATEIDWAAAIDLQAAAQKWVCHAISKTINLPADVSIDEVKKVYWEGWKRGLKGVTVYRDGSRSGVLISKEENDTPGFKSHCAPKRPQILDCEIHHTTVKGEDWTILVGLMDGRPYEIMGGLQQYIEIPKKYKYGELLKHSYKSKDSRYDLVIERNGDQLAVKDIVKMFDNPNHSAFTRTISLALRHGAKIQYVVEQLQKDREADMFSFAKVTARVLKKYIANGTKVSMHVCENCSSDGSLVYQEGCMMCTACGYSKCS